MRIFDEDLHTELLLAKNGGREGFWDRLGDAACLAVVMWLVA
jgi:hypothetical protein